VQPAERSIWSNRSYGSKGNDRSRGMGGIWPARPIGLASVGVGGTEYRGDSKNDL